MIILGPSAPFIGIAILGIVAGCLVVATVLISHRGKCIRRQINSGYKSVVVLLVAAMTFALWGSSTGHGGPHTDGGMIGYTYGGVLHYVTAISHQSSAGMPWSHDWSVEPLALLGTIGLNAVTVIAGLLGSWWIGGEDRTF